MQSLSLRTAILNNSSLKIAVGEMHSPVQNQRENRESKKSGASIVMPSAIEVLVAPQKTSWIFFSCVESGSRAQTIARNTQRTHHHTSFTRVGCPTQAIHERENAVLVDKSNGTIGAAANGCGDIKDTTTLAYQCEGT